MKPGGSVAAICQKAQEQANEFVTGAADAWNNQSKGPLKFVLGDLVDLTFKVVNSVLEARTAYFDGSKAQAEAEQAWQRSRIGDANAFADEVRWATWDSIPAGSAK